MKLQPHDPPQKQKKQHRPWSSQGDSVGLSGNWRTYLEQQERGSTSAWMHAAAHHLQQCHDGQEILC
jgi:hypothetical protein